MVFSAFSAFSAVKSLRCRGGRFPSAPQRRAGDAAGPGRAAGERPGNRPLHRRPLGRPQRHAARRRGRPRLRPPRLPRRDRPAAHRRTGRALRRRQRRGQAREAGRFPPRRQAGLRRELDGVLERPAAQRRADQHRRPAQADHCLALQLSFGEQAARPVHGGAAEPRQGRPRRLPQGGELARPRQRQPDAAGAGGPERLAGVPGQLDQVRLVPRQLHQRMEAGTGLRHGQLLLSAKSGNGPLRQADRQDRAAEVPVPRPRRRGPQAPTGRRG